MEAFGNKVRSETENLQEQKAKAQQQDDESGRSVDEITRQITDASQIGKHKQQTLKDNEKRIGQLQNQVKNMFEIDAVLLGVLKTQDPYWCPNASGYPVYSAELGVSEVKVA